MHLCLSTLDLLVIVPMAYSVILLPMASLLNYSIHVKSSSHHAVFSIAFHQMLAKQDYQKLKWRRRVKHWMHPICAFLSVFKRSNVYMYSVTLFA